MATFKLGDTSRRVIGRDDESSTFFSAQWCAKEKLIMSRFVDFQGASLRTYRYFILEEWAPYNIPTVAGNYTFARVLPGGTCRPMYFGVADNLRSRLTTHERLAEAVDLGANLIAFHPSQGGELWRCEEEKDLIRFWNPLLNVQHRTAL